MRVTLFYRKPSLQNFGECSCFPHFKPYFKEPYLPLRLLIITDRVVYHLYLGTLFYNIIIFVVLRWKSNNLMESNGSDIAMAILDFSI